MSWVSSVMHVLYGHEGIALQSLVVQVTSMQCMCCDTVSNLLCDRQLSGLCLHIRRIF